MLTENIDNVNFIGELAKDGDFQRLAKFMIATQFWRTPCRKQQAITYAPKILSLYDKADDEIKEILGNDRSFVKFLSKRAKKDHSLKLIQFLLLPLLTFDISQKVIKIKLFKASKNKKFISSDRPVIFDNLEDLFSLKSFLFPFSKDLLLVGTGRNIKLLDIDKVNYLITSRASEVVISCDREQLVAQKKLLNKSIKDEKHNS